MNAEQRRLAVAGKRDPGLPQLRRDILDKIAERALDRALVSGAVRLEPFPGLVEGERLEERQRVGAEALDAHRIIP